MSHLTPIYRCAMDVIEHADDGDSIGTIADVIDKKAVEPFRAKLKECLQAFNFMRSTSTGIRIPAKDPGKTRVKTTYDLASEIETLLKQYPER